MIEPIHIQRGYNDLVTFINNQLSSPTVGRHSEIIDEINLALPVRDYYCFVQELYYGNSYKGVYMVSAQSNKVLYIEDGVPISFNYSINDTIKLFVMSPTGLGICYSDLISLYDVVTERLSHSLQIMMNVVYGAEVYFSLMYVNGHGIGRGILQSQLVMNQLLTSYNLKIDKTPYDTVSFKSALNNFMSFHVEVADGIFEQFSYERMGVNFVVQDTEYSRRSLQKLSKQGIVFINF